MSAIPDDGPEYSCHTTNYDNWIAVRFFYWPRGELKYLLEKIVGKENFSKLEGKESYVSTLGIKGKNGDIDIFFSQVDLKGWNCAIEISGHDKSIVAHLDMHFCLCLKFLGIEVSELACDEDERKPTKTKKRKTIEFCSIYSSKTE